MTGKLFPRMLFLHRNCCTWLRCWFGCADGGFIRQSQAQAELHGLLQRQRENLEIAHALHDYISNDITDASLLLGQAQEGDFTRIADAMQCFDDASARSHELIARLEPTQFSEKPPHDAISYATVPKRSSAAVSGEIMLNELRQTVSEKQANLTALGLDGIVLLPEMIPGAMMSSLSIFF